MDEAQKVYKASPKDIQVIDRERKTFDRKKQEELEASIRINKQMQPGVCMRGEDETLILCAGHRRLLACEALGIEFEFILREEIEDPDQLKVIEIEENLQREDFTWREEVEAKRKLQEIYIKRYGAPKSGPGPKAPSSIDSIAQSIGVSVGSLSSDIELAEFARELPEVSKAKTKAEAKKLIKQMKERLERHERIQAATTGTNADGTQKDFEELRDADESSFEWQSRSPEEIEAHNKAVAQMRLDKRIQYYSSKVLCGKFEDQALEPESFDVVVWDPLWGVGFDEVSEDVASQKKYEDTKDFAADFKKFLPLVWSLMKPDSHLYVVFGIVHHQVVYDLLEAQGFETNRMPLIWYKEGAHRVRQAQRWPGRSYEPVAFARKGNKDIDLFYRGRPDVIPTPQPTPKMKGIHPSAKHPALYLELLRRSCEPGNKVLDPMAGSGMFGVAAEKLNEEFNIPVDWTMIEMDKDYWNQTIANLVMGYERIVGDTSEPEVEGLPEDFRELEPGTAEWKSFWKLHPEMQEDMLKWVADRRP